MKQWLVEKETRRNLDVGRLFDSCPRWPRDWRQTGLFGGSSIWLAFPPPKSVEKCRALPFGPPETSTRTVLDPSTRGSDLQVILAQGQPTARVFFRTEEIPPRGGEASLFTRIETPAVFTIAHGSLC